MMMTTRAPDKTHPPHKRGQGWHGRAARGEVEAFAGFELQPPVSWSLWSKIHHYHNDDNNNELFDDDEIDNDADGDDDDDADDNDMSMMMTMTSMQLTKRRQVRSPRKEMTRPPAIKAKLPRILPTFIDNCGS